MTILKTLKPLSDDQEYLKKIYEIKIVISFEM